jgi:hypothetical protein
MRRILPIAVVSVLAAPLCAWAAPPPVTLTLDEETAVDGPSAAEAPVLEWNRAHILRGKDGTITTLPDLHFMSRKAKVVSLRRELAKSSASNGLEQQVPYSIDISDAQQVEGALDLDPWTCGADAYFVSMRAFVIDADGRRSNAVRYTVHCNGG